MAASLRFGSAWSRLFALALLSAALLPAAEGKLIFTKVFPGSVPPWVRIELDAAGNARYLESATDEAPVVWKLNEQDTQTMFALAEKLDRFNRKLESGLPVAKMGDKTLTLLDAAGKKLGEQTFNYSQDLDAQALTDWFEKMSETTLYRIDFERAVRFEPLGVNQAILKLQAAWERKRIVGYDQFLKLLDRVVKSERYMNMSRERAAELAAKFRAELAGPAAPPSGNGSPANAAEASGAPAAAAPPAATPQTPAQPKPKPNQP